MSVVQDDRSQTEYISCPHLTADTADDEGCRKAMFEGSYNTLVDDDQSHVVLLLCSVCADVVKSGILDKIVSRSMENSIRHLGLK